MIICTTFGFFHDYLFHVQLSSTPLILNHSIRFTFNKVCILLKIKRILYHFYNLCNILFHTDSNHEIISLSIANGESNLSYYCFQNSVLSSGPYLLQGIFCFMTSWASNWMQKNEYASVNSLRKGFSLLCKYILKYVMYTNF